MLGVPPLKGRTFSEAENVPGADDVVVISHGLWMRRFGGRDDVVESKVELSGRTVRVIGVMPQAFSFPSRDTEFWVPTAPSEQIKTNGSFWLQSVGRLKAGVAVEQAQADLARIKAARVQQDPSTAGYGVYVVDYFTQVVGRVRTAVLVLLGAVAFVLLIACTNVANLLLARASTREREVALRAAIGAGRGRIVRQFVTESVLLGCVGGLAGIGLAFAGLKALLIMAPEDLPRVADMRLDAGVLAFAGGLSVLTGLLFGTLPALQAATGDLNRAMREGGRGSTGPGRSIRRGLVVLEVGAAVVLLVGAGLMIRSFNKLQNVDLGFNTDHVLTARVTLYGQRYTQPDTRSAFFRDLLERTRASQGVDGVGAVGTIMLSATPSSANFSIDGRPDFPPEKRVEVPIDAVAADYFTTMKVPLLKGRLFDARDARTGEQVVIINSTMANMYWPGDDPLGKRIKYGLVADGGPWMTIVGVVADTRRTGFDSPVRPETYLPHAQASSSSMVVVIRGADRARTEAALRGAVRAIDPAIPVHAVRPLTDVVGVFAAQRRLNTLLLTVFAIVAALLAAIGIYGVMAYSVAERTREIGVRMALGASRSDIMRLVLYEGLALSVAGIIVGLAGALALGRLVTTLLYDIPATDVPTFVAITAIAAATALVASLVPAIRAVRLAATDALRAE